MLGFRSVCPEFVIGTSGAGYSAAACDFDGVDDRIKFSTSAVTMAAGKQLTFSGWFNFDSVTGHRFLVQARNGGSGPQWRFTMNPGAGNFIFFAHNAASTTILNVNGSVTPTTGQWYHILFSCDLTSTSLRHFYINGASSVGAWTTYSNDTMVLDRTDLNIGADDGLGNDFDGEMGPLWIDNTYIDFSVSSNREKFADTAGDPVDLGPNGETPTGTAPDLYMKFITGSLGVNSGGDGGTGTLSGTSAGNLLPVGY